MVFMEDLIAENLDLVFPGLEIVEAYPFRIARDADIDIAFYEAPDLLTAIEDVLEEREMGQPIMLQVGKSMPDQLKELFMKNLKLPPEMVYPVNDPLGLVDLWQLLSIERPKLKDAPFLPYTPNELSENKNILSAVSRRDYVFYHPYDNFNVIVNMLRQAASDPNVLAIKITLYRIDRNSPVIDALLTARQNGKAVTALVELKARFDEQNNINWARMLEREGVHVVYGLVDLKVHAKICLIVRKEGEKIIRYSHIGSGNYNAVTTRIYGDISYLTANDEIGSDISLLFNALTGYSQKEKYKHLLVAPKTLKKEIIRRIEREIAVLKKTGKGYIGLKLNGLVDKEIIQALYRASMEGVKIELNVRGLCCLRPGVPNYSENITVHSIVGRFLEHARIYYFKNGGNEEVLLGSSDLMPRNLINRIEVLIPVPDRRLMKSVIDYMLEPHLRDNVKSRKLLPNGSYERIFPPEGGKPMNSQTWLIENRGVWHKLPRNGKKK
jgi:polyphosphate kinase